MIEFQTLLSFKKTVLFISETGKIHSLFLTPLSVCGLHVTGAAVKQDQSTPKSDELSAPQLLSHYLTTEEFALLHKGFIC